mmetsp:Transcript_19900/g.59486  ORF Transcript_19900/g.59486 Transcript_19900/m.59486 type:complete len:227 (+) Transcript_19900:964-1644(+)
MQYRPPAPGLPMSRTLRPKVATTASTITDAPTIGCQTVDDSASGSRAQYQHDTHPPGTWIVILCCVWAPRTSQRVGEQIALQDTLVDLLGKVGEDALWKITGLFLDESLQSCVALLLVVLVNLLQVEFLVDRLHLGHLCVVVLGVVVFENLLLLRRRPLERLHDEPTALVVLNIGPNLANNGWVAVAVEVVILNLEELAHLEKDCQGILELDFLGDACHVHPHRHG